MGREVRKNVKYMVSVEKGSGRYRHEGKAFVPSGWVFILWVAGSQPWVRLEVGGAVSLGTRE